LKAMQRSLKSFAILAALAFVLALPTTAMAQPFKHMSGEWREYIRDWLAVCPPKIVEDATSFYGVSCFASTYSAEKNAANRPAFQLTILRNRLNGNFDVAFTLAGSGFELDTTRPLQLAFPGEPAQSFDFLTDLETRYSVTNQYFVVDPARRAELIEVMKHRNALTLTLPIAGPQIKKEVRLSLMGLLASLDFLATYARRVEEY
jgi:invasion protein IalB